MLSRLRLVIKRITPGASFALLLISQYPAIGFSQAVAPAAKAAEKPASERWVKDFRAFVEKVRAALPGTRIAFVSLSPSPKRWEQVEEQKEANRLVKEYVRSGKDLDYIELWDQFLGPDGKPREDLFVEDRLHNNQ